jgi:hypothetical protein
MTAWYAQIELPERFKGDYVPRQGSLATDPQMSSRINEGRRKFEAEIRYEEAFARHGFVSGYQVLYWIEY